MKIDITESAKAEIFNSLSWFEHLRVKIIAIRGVVIGLELIGRTHKDWLEVIKEDEPFTSQYLDETNKLKAKS